MKKKIFLGLFILLVIFCCLGFYLVPSPKLPLTLPVVTVMNPIRGSQLGLEKLDLLKSLQGQWQVTKNIKIPATWLWQYSALEDSRLTNFAKSQMRDQEFGIFLEIDRNFSDKADVVYRGHGPWYFSDGLFLNGYDRGERRKLIDTVFKKFKTTFGYYPKTVGGWWVGADALHYMHDKYGVIASLQVADQFNLDVYTVWGQPWSIPYVASKNNAAAPAQTFGKSSHIVIMQWAPRDPTFGYGNKDTFSTYSMQDYQLKSYDSSYASYLIDVFLHKPYDQLVIGLEAGFPPQSYNDQYKTHLQIANALQKQNKISIQTAESFAENFLSREKVFGGTSYYLSTGYQSKDQSFWYNGEKYRAGIEKKGDDIFLVDVRDYTNQTSEEFLLLPNSQGFLRINASPAVIDSAHLPNTEVLIGKSSKQLQLHEENSQITLTDGEREFARFTQNDFTLLLITQTFSFEKKGVYFNSFFILFGILLFYMIFIFLMQKNKINVVVHFIILGTCLVVSFPFLSSGNSNTMTFLFERKQLFLLPLIKFIPFGFSWNLVLIFQIIPFIILLIFHFIFVIKAKMIHVYALYVFIFILFYSHVPDFIITEFFTKKKIAVIAGLSIYFFIALSLFAFMFYKKKSRIIFFKVFVGFILGLILVGSTLLFSWQKFALTSFEQESLIKASLLKKDVYYVMPKEQPVYRAVTPLLFKNYRYGEIFTNVHWQEVNREEGKFLNLDNGKNKIIFVPRYLGSDIFPEEIKKYKLKKIFDNAQIVIMGQ